MSDTIEASQQFIDTYFGGNSKLFEAIDYIDKASINGHLDEPTYQEFIINEWLKYLASFEDFPTLIERFWWYVAFEWAGMSFIDIVMKPYLKVMVDKYWEQFKDGFMQSKNEGLVPNNIKTAEDYLALIFAKPEARPYTNDPVYQVLGVKTGKELEALSYAEVTFKQAKMVVDGTFAKLHNAAFHGLQRAFDNNDAKGDCKIDEIKLQRLYSQRRKPSRDEKRTSIDAQLEDSAIIRKGYEYNGTYDVKDSDNLEPELEDGDRLSQFANLSGISLSEFTPKEQDRILDLIGFFHRGNEKSSKTGISFKDYYGDRAESEKTQRQRLFKKIKEASDKTKLA